MKFLDVYEVNKEQRTKIFEELKKDMNSEMIGKGYEEINYCGLYIQQDVLDFHIFRVIENMNEDYEEDEDLYLVELQNISKVDFIEEYCANHNIDFRKKYGFMHRANVKDFIDNLNTRDIIKNLLFTDDNDLSNWDCKEYYSLEETQEEIYGSYTLITDWEEK